MNAKDAIRQTMDVSLMVLDAYIGDLSDADLLRRPTAGCNHLAWQLGHLISSEAQLLNGVCPGKAASLPPGFAEQHARETCSVDDPTRFRTKQQYQDAFKAVRASTLAALESLSDADLEKPSPEFLRDKFPTVGHVFTLIGTHPMMHAGQFVVVRRQLNKPVVI